MFLPNVSDANSVEIGSLIDDDTDQHSAVGTTLDSHFLGVRVAISNQIFSSRMAIVKGVLLFKQPATIVPSFSIFPVREIEPR